MRQRGARSTRRVGRDPDEAGEGGRAVAHVLGDHVSPNWSAASRLESAASPRLVRLGDLACRVGGRRDGDAARAERVDELAALVEGDRVRAEGPDLLERAAAASRRRSGRSAASPRRRSRAAPRRAGRASRRPGRGASSRSGAPRARPRAPTVASTTAMKLAQRLAAGAGAGRAAPSPRRCGCRRARGSRRSTPLTRPPPARALRPRPTPNSDGASPRRRDRASAGARARSSTAASSARASTRLAQPVLEQRARASAASRSGSRAPLPAMSGAEPCTGSKIPGPRSPRLAEEASPSPPVTPAATSERMSPKVFSVTSTSKASGSITSCIATLSTSAVAELDVGVVGGELRRRHAATSARSRARCLVDRESRRRARARELERAPRDPLDLVGVVLAGVEDGAVRARPAGAVVEAADELAHDQRGRRPRRPRGAGWRRRRAPCAARSAPASGRTAPPSQRGPPTAPSSTASAPRHAASVSGGSGSPQASIAAPPKRCSDGRARAGAPRARARACRHHLRPDPVAGQADDPPSIAMDLPPHQVEHVAGRCSATPSAESGPALACLQRADQRTASRLRVAQRQPVRELVVVRAGARSRAAG